MTEFRPMSPIMVRAIYPPEAVMNGHEARFTVLRVEMHDAFDALARRVRAEPVVPPAALRVGALVAAGAWIAPSQQLYLVLPGLSLRRGGIRWDDGPVTFMRWYARSRWGRRVKRVLFGVQWA